MLIKLSALKNFKINNHQDVSRAFNIPHYSPLLDGLPGLEFPLGAEDLHALTDGVRDHNPAATQIRVANALKRNKTVQEFKRKKKKVSYDVLRITYR